MKTSMFRKVIVQAPLIAAAVLLSANALAGTFTFVAKQTDAKGQTHYKYEFSCASGQNQGTFTVVATSDEAAKKAAEQKVKVVCEE